MAFCGAVALQFLIHCLDILALNIAFVGSEAAAEAAGYVHKFVDEGFFFVFGGHFVVDFRDNLDSVGWG